MTLTVTKSRDFFFHETQSSGTSQGDTGAEGAGEYERRGWGARGAAGRRGWVRKGSQRQGTGTGSLGNAVAVTSEW